MAIKLKYFRPWPSPPFRQGHKTDKNDALAVAEAANRPDIKEAPYKNSRSTSTTIDTNVPENYWSAIETALSNHIRGILLEFGFVIRQGYSALHQLIPEILECGDNELPDSYRPHTATCYYTRLCDLRDDIQMMDKEISKMLSQNESCQRLTELEGVGPISAILLFATLGTGEAFKNGREYSAYIGLTPQAI